MQVTNNQLLKDFNIFALNKSDILNNKLCSYINENISSYSSDISLSDCAFNTFSYMTDNEGTMVSRSRLLRLWNMECIAMCLIKNNSLF